MKSFFKIFILIISLSSLESFSQSSKYSGVEKVKQQENELKEELKKYSNIASEHESVKLREMQYDSCNSKKQSGYNLVLFKNRTGKNVYIKFYNGKSDKLKWFDYKEGQRGNQLVLKNETVAFCTMNTLFKVSYTKHGNAVAAFFSGCKNCSANIKDKNEYTLKNGYGSQISTGNTKFTKDDFLKTKFRFVTVKVNE